MENKKKKKWTSLVIIRPIPDKYTSSGIEKIDGVRKLVVRECYFDGSPSKIVQVYDLAGWKA